MAIAGALNLSRQQVHKIIDKLGNPALATLRKEVMESDFPYKSLLKDDQDHVDWAVRELAKERGISL